jgi:MFS family permease
MTSTATIELESPQQPPSPQPTAENFGQTDNVVAQSQLADSTVPDGEYGWVIVFACSVLAFWFIGTTYCWGVVQAPLVQEGLASASTLSFVGSLAVAANSFFAIMSARIMQRIGTRWTAVIGVSILSAGELFAGFATHSVGGLFATAGVTLGVGVSLCFAAVSTVTAQYFYRKRGLANGLVFAGGGLGGAIISFAMNTLIDRLGVAWTFRVIGFLQLATGLPAAMLIKERARVHRNIFIEWSLFKDLTFILIFVAGAIATFPLFVPPFFLPLYARSVGLSSAAGAGLVAGFNFASALGRVGFGMMADKAGPLNSLFIGLALCATSMLVMWPVSDSLAPLILFVLINGAANGSFFATMPTVVGNLFGSIRVAVAMGMVVTSW